MADVQAVISALDALSQATTDRASFVTANTWLQDFQHSVNNFALGRVLEQRLIRSTSE
jgi:transportin-3